MTSFAYQIGHVILAQEIDLNPGFDGKCLAVFELQVGGSSIVLIADDNVSVLPGELNGQVVLCLVGIERWLRAGFVEFAAGSGPVLRRFPRVEGPLSNRGRSIPRIRG